MTQTQLELATNGTLTPEMETIAAAEGVTAAVLCRDLARGRIVIPKNHNRSCRSVGIGQGLSTKINASIGTSTDRVDIEAEVRKAVAAEAAGADTLMELSVGGI